MMFPRIAIPALLLGCLSMAAPRCGASELFDTLVQQGVQLGPQETVRLPTPLLNDPMDGEARRRAIGSIINGRYDWETFSRKSVVSPFVLKISENDRQAGKIGRQVDIYFVAYGPLSKLSSDDYLQKQLGIAVSDSDTESGGRAKLLKPDELIKRGLPATQAPGQSRWVALEGSFLGKVRIRLTTRNVKTATNGSVIVASIADPAFKGDAEYPNQWQSITVDEAGRRQVGPPEPYGGLGSYMKATKLDAADDRLFIEHHIVFAEPDGWFHGTNLLRSKLPIAAQDMVRKFRRNLSKPD